MEVHYIKLPLNTIPFEEIPSLENIAYNYVNCSYFSLKTFMGVDYILFSVYDTFTDIDVNEIDESNLLFGRVISETPTKRGINKVVSVTSIKTEITKSDLANLKYSNNNQIDGNWFYVKDGASYF